MDSFVSQSPRRRRVLRSLGLYIGISWLTIQVTSVLLSAFEAPIWLLRSLIVMAVAGSPVVVATAWFRSARAEELETSSKPGGSAGGALDRREFGILVIGLLTIALIFSIYLNVSDDSAVPQDVRPVTALIADFENRTSEAVFDGVLEQLLTFGLDAAPYVALFDRRQAQDLAGALEEGVKGLPLRTAQLIAVRQAIALVLEGSVERAGRGYRLRVAGMKPLTGEKMFEFSSEAAEQDRVPESMASLARAVRDELSGSELRESNDPLYDRPEGYRVTSLEAAKLYADASRFDTEGDFVSAADLYRKAAELQPDWPAIYGGWAIAEFNRGRIEEAERLFDTTLSLLSDASETDRLFYLGTYFLLIREDYDNALRTISDYVELAPLSSAGINNLAVAAFYTLDFERAKQVGERLVDVFPRNSLYLSNLALYAMYAGDFDTAASHARQVIQNDPSYGYAYLPLAVAALEDRAPQRALDLYKEMAATDLGVRNGGAQAIATIGAVDVELYLGRFEAARARLLEDTDRLTDGSTNVPVIQQILLAESYASSGDRALAIEAAQNAQALSGLISVKVASALILAAVGELEAVELVADELSNRLAAHGRSYGLMLRAVVLREQARYSEALELLGSALDIADLWRIHMELGQTYLEAGDYAAALDEFERCRERRGEATAMFLDDVPTYRYLAELPYWTARAQTGLGMNEAAAANYDVFLSLRPEGGPYTDVARAQLAQTRSAPETVRP